MYLKVSGQRSGAIKGDVTKPGHTDTIGVLRFQEGDVSPRDPQSGLPTGKITHKPFVIVKELDKASPLLFNALVANETLTSFIFDIFQLDNRGVETLAKSITLSGASVASWTHRKVRDEAGKVREVEEVSFTYQAMDGAIKPATILRRPLPMIKTVKP
jgi:type VI secretion system secreted protein Hcp